MPQTFTIRPGHAISTPQSENRHVLVTGVPGNIGSYFAEHTHEKYRLRLMTQRRDDARDLATFGEVVEGDLSDLQKLTRVCQGVDTVVHLAADPGPDATWDSLLPNNIIGTYNMFVAAKAAGCRRVIYASSIHAVSGYPADVQVKTSDPVNPGDLYGVSKCFGEALGRYMAEQEGLSVIAIRIGAFQPLSTAQDPGWLALMDSFVSRRDLTALIECCIDDESLQFAVFNGLSNNRFKRLDISDARALVGYDPVDDFTQENPRLEDLDLSDAVPAGNVSDRGQESGLRNQLP